VSAPLSPDPVRQLGDDRLPPYVSNGVVALRVPAVSMIGGLAVLNGLAGLDPSERVEATPALPYPLGCDLEVNGVWLSQAPEQARALEQVYDFGCGELTTTFWFQAGDVRATVSVITFASRTQPSVVAQETTVTVDRTAEIALRAVLSPGALPGRIVARSQGIPGEDDVVVDGTMRWQPYGELSVAGIAYTTELLGGTGVARVLGDRHVGPVDSTYRFEARPGSSYRLRHLAALVPERVHHDPDRQATRLVALAATIGFDALRTANQVAWRELWKGRILLVGAERRWQALADAAFFYLNTSVHSSSLASTNIFGLAQWPGYHYYYGHVMWDIEVFALPPLLLTQPDAARALLEYRSRSLEAARFNAKLWGYRGAQFAWESGPARGEEAAPKLGTAAMYEHHVSMAVAHAFAQYAHATGDDRFLQDEAWPILADVAEWIVSRVERSSRGFEIRRAMGIAERKEPSDNVAYVNMTACIALDDAISTANALHRPVPEAWSAVRDGMVIPMAGGVILDHDGHHPDMEKGATPAALCGLFPFGYDVPADVFEATTRFYLDLAEEYIGSPMLSALYGAWAARIGERKASADLFDAGYAQFVSPRFLNTHEYRDDRLPEGQPPAGPFAANIGGFLTACLYGLTGLHIRGPDPSKWPRHVAAMPDGWDGIEVERVWIQGRPVRLQARHGDRARLDPLD
jgi:Glycosyl hydrolase family 65 central catalytic domain